MLHWVIPVLLNQVQKKPRPAPFLVVEVEGDSNNLSWGYVAIYGDLRDYDSVQGIVDWFKNSLEKLRKPDNKPIEQMTEYEKALFMLASFSIRDAVLSINVEGSPRTILAWKDDVLIQQQVGS
jgi:hypothetical protein